jgi:hypothetical protein
MEAARGRPVRRDATLLRPAIDPAVPRRARNLLTTRGAALPPASGPRPSRSRQFLPAHPEKRETIVYDAVTGITAAPFVAVAGG